jgi:hypothetical protein
MGHKPNPRERASFLSGILPMQRKRTIKLYTGQKAILSKNQNCFGIFFADGHTEKQMIPHIYYKDKTIVFALIYWPQLDIFLFLM